MLMAAAGQAGRGQYEQVDHVDRRFPGLLDSVITADDPALV
jgi:hypothetical protein